MPDDTAVQQSNVSATLWAEALRVYIEDKGAENRARGVTKKHQLAYKSQGIDPQLIRDRYREANMSPDERAAAYAAEELSRRALRLNLWDADTKEDFDRLMERAQAVEPAPQVDIDGIAGARAYADGWNSGSIGGARAETDNPHLPGTIMHQQWAIGCADGLAEREGNARQAPEQTPAASDVPQAPRKRGRPRKQQAAAPEPHDDEPPVISAAEEIGSLFDDDLDDDNDDAPAMPGMPD